MPEEDRLRRVHIDAPYGVVGMILGQDPVTFLVPKLDADLVSDERVSLPLWRKLKALFGYHCQEHVPPAKPATVEKKPVVASNRTAAKQRAKAMRLYEEGMKLYRAGEFADAGSKLRELVETGEDVGPVRGKKADAALAECGERLAQQPEPEEEEVELAHFEDEWSPTNGEEKEESEVS